MSLIVWSLLWFSVLSGQQYCFIFEWFKDIVFLYQLLDLKPECLPIQTEKSDDDDDDDDDGDDHNDDDELFLWYGWLTIGV